MSLFFGFKGRIGRVKFWLLQIFLGVVCISTTIFLLEHRKPDFFNVSIIAVFALSAFWSFSLMSLFVRRLHDLDKSGWWYVPYYFIPKSMIGLSTVYPEIDVPLAVKIAVGAIGIWGVLEVCFIGGTKYPNRFDYGPPLIQA